MVYPKSISAKAEKGISKFFIYSGFLCLTFPNITSFLSVASSARSSLFLIVHIALFFLLGTDLPSTLTIPGSGESALIFSSHLLVGQFSLLNLFFPEYNFNYKKTAWVSLGGFSSTVGARPFFYCDLAFRSWLPSAKEVPCLSAGISKEGTLLCLATSSNVIFYDVKETYPWILSSWKRDGNFLHLQRQKIKSSSEGLSLPPPIQFHSPWCFSAVFYNF